MPVVISPGNSKVGRIPNVSLPPLTTCPPDAPCRAHCYARKAWRMYPGTRAAWQGNLDFYNADHVDYFLSVYRALWRRKPSLFRWHVGGDCPSQDYANRLEAVAKLTPDTRHLVFTKRYDWWSTTPPANLSIVLSTWPGYPLPERTNLPRAWLAHDPRRPATALLCSGGCDTCGACWGLRGTGLDVCFDQH